jgi:hypothetical protein
MMRVISAGSARTVSFQPASVGAGGRAGPVKRSAPLDPEVQTRRRAAVEYLEPDQMQMDGVRILRQIDEFPNFGGVEFWLFGDGHVPGRVVEQHAHGVLHVIEELVEGEAAGGDSDGSGIERLAGRRVMGTRPVIADCFGGDAKLENVEGVADHADMSRRPWARSRQTISMRSAGASGTRLRCDWRGNKP